MQEENKVIYEIFFGSSIRQTAIRLGQKISVGTVSHIFFNDNKYKEYGHPVFDVWCQDGDDIFHWKELWKGEQDSIHVTYKK